MKSKKWIITLSLFIMLLACLPVQAASFKLNKKTLSLASGETATLIPSGYSGSITWKSSNKRVATVSKKGEIYAFSRGRTIITAKNNGKKVKCTVNVYPDTIYINDFCVKSAGFEFDTLNPYGDVFTILKNSASDTAYVDFTKQEAAWYSVSVKNVLMTARGITLNMSVYDVIGAYGRNYNYSAFNTQDKMYRIALESFDDEESFAGIKYCLVYTYEKQNDFIIRFYFDNKDKLVRVVYVKGYDKITDYDGYSGY